MACMFREDVNLSDGELRDHFTHALSDARLDTEVRRVEVEFGEDADEQLALFITAVVEQDGLQSDEERLVALSRTLHEKARRLELPVPWYVRVQDEQALSDDQLL